MYDLDEYDAEIINKKSRQIQFTSDEEEIERLCDDERYLALNKCLEEEALHQGELSCLFQVHYSKPESLLMLLKKKK